MWLTNKLFEIIWQALYYILGIFTKSYRFQSKRNETETAYIWDLSNDDGKFRIIVYNHTFGNLEIQRYDEQGPSYKLYAIIQ